MLDNRFGCRAFLHTQEIITRNSSSPSIRRPYFATCFVRTLDRDQGEGAMTRFGGNIGRFDAISRRVVGACAVLGGLASLEGFFWSMGFLTWVLLAMMIALGLFYIT